MIKLFRCQTFWIVTNKVLQKFIFENIYDNKDYSYPIINLKTNAQNMGTQKVYKINFFHLNSVSRKMVIFEIQEL